MELSEEINLAKNYIFLIQTRFENDYIFSFEENSIVKDKFIPTGALQTLLENVVKHNKKHTEPIKTSIKIDENYIEITNTKYNIETKSDSFGTGLENLKTRYKHLSNNEVVITNTANKFTVSIPIIKLSE